jgi:hypothetical protein
MKNTNTIKLILTLGLILGYTALSFAQPGGGGPSTPAPFGFLEVLIGAGAVYGSKKLWDNHRKKTE